MRYHITTGIGIGTRIGIGAGKKYRVSEVSVNPGIGLSLFINDLDCGILSSLLKFADDMKLFGIVNSHNDRQTLQQDLQKLTDWSHDWQMPFNVDKCKIMHVGWSKFQVLHE